MNKQNDFENYQVVRQDYIAAGEAPQLTFNQGRMYVNNFCIKEFPDKDYIQVLVNSEEKLIVVRPLQSMVKDSFKWCSQGKKRKARRMRCIPLFYLTYKMMQWNINARYRTTGHIEQTNGEKVCCFCLNEAQCFLPTGYDEDTGRIIYRQQMPLKWDMTFGISTEEYAQCEYMLHHKNEGVIEIELPIDRNIKEKVRNAKKEI